MDETPSAEAIRLQALLDHARDELHRARQSRATLRRQNRELRRKVKHLEHHNRILQAECTQFDHVPSASRTDRDAAGTLAADEPQGRA